MPFPTSVDTILDAPPVTANTRILSSQVLGPQRITVGPVWNNVKSDQYGAKGDGVTDDTTAITAAINALPASGGICYFPPGNYLISSSLPIKSGVTYMGAGWGAELVTQPSTISAAAGMTTPLFDITGTVSIFGTVFQGLALNGPGAVSGSKGIHSGPNVQARAWTFRDLFFNSFGDHAIHIEPSSQATATAYMTNLFVQNALLVRTGRASLVGTIDTAFTDLYAFGCFATASNATGDGTGNIAAWVTRGSNSCYVACFGELSQLGWGIPSTVKWIRMIGCRAALNNGQGYQVDGATCQFLNCQATSNSQTTDNTSSGFVVTGAGCTFIGCNIDGNAGDTKQQKNGFDDSNSVAGANGNNYVFNRAGVIRGVLYNGTGTANNVRVDPDGGGGLLAMVPNGNGFAIDPLVGSFNATLNLNARLAGVQKQVQIIADQTGNLALIPLAGSAISCRGALQPSTAAGAAQGGQVFQGSGVPSNANGNNGDVYFRTDTPGTANQRMYMKSAGAWVALTL